MIKPSSVASHNSRQSLGISNPGSFWLDSHLESSEMSRRRPTSWLDEVGATNARPAAIPRDLKPFDLDIPTDATPRSLRANSFPASVLLSEDFPSAVSPGLPAGIGARRPTFAATSRPPGLDTASASPPLNFAYNAPASAIEGTMPLGISQEERATLPHPSRMTEGMWRQTPDSTDRNQFNGLGQPLPSASDVDDEEDMERIRNIPSPPPVNAALAGRGKVFCVVGFKCWRADIYVQDHRHAEFTEELKKMDIVVVEADRGNDIGTILFTTNSAYKAERFCHVLNTRHTREIVRSSIHFSQFWRSVVPPMPSPAQVHSLDQADHQKKVRRKALPHEIVMITDKEYIEVKAKRTCQHYVQKHGLNMEILDAEFQADYQKLTFFYFAPHYVTFNALVHDLYKCFKKRIWMSAVNNMAAVGAAPRAAGRPPFEPLAGQYGEY